LKIEGVLGKILEQFHHLGDLRVNQGTITPQNACGIERLVAEEGSSPLSIGDMALSVLAFA
jgi:hypothetical protein